MTVEPVPADFSNLADMTRFNARTRAPQVAFHFEGDAATYADLDSRSSACANLLIGLGVKSGDRVAHLGKNTHLYYEILLGAAKAGAVMTPINWRLAAPEIAYILTDCRSSVLFIGPEFADFVREHRAQFGSVRHIIGVERADGAFPGYPVLRDSSDATDPMLPCAPDDDVLQMYTSGTTGRPKGAVLTNRSILRPDAARPAEDIPDWESWSEDDVGLVAMPCFHIGGTGYGLTVLRNGATGVVAREFDPHSVLDLIEQFRISKMFMVPAAMQIVVNLPKAREVDFSRLRHIAYGASPIPLALLRTCIDVFRCGFVQMYGMTETTGTIAVLPPEDHDPAGNARMRSVGKPLYGVEMKIIDAAGNTLPPHQVGEIAIRSIANMKGYWNKPDATGETIDGDGWLRSGDAGYVDEDGYFYIHDRVKDMIISGGENVYPAEVENALFAHPGIADVAVIGVPDGKWGEAVKACVVVKAGEQLTEGEIVTWARTQIAGFKCPKSVDFIEALPRNASGKILRRELRAPYWVGFERNVN